MDSSMINKVEKAKKYAEETGRVQISSFQATFKGDHDTYNVTFDSGEWTCECFFYTPRGVCSHTMALQRMLDNVLPREVVSA